MTHLIFLLRIKRKWTRFKKSSSSELLQTDAIALSIIELTRCQSMHEVESSILLFEKGLWRKNIVQWTPGMVLFCLMPKVLQEVVDASGDEVDFLTISALMNVYHPQSSLRIPLK